MHPLDVTPTTSLCSSSTDNYSYYCLFLVFFLYLKNYFPRRSDHQSHWAAPRPLTLVVACSRLSRAAPVAGESSSGISRRQLGATDFVQDSHDPLFPVQYGICISNMGNVFNQRLMRARFVCVLIFVKLILPILRCKYLCTVNEGTCTCIPVSPYLIFSACF